jgi:hypothetical protein
MTSTIAAASSMSMGRSVSLGVMITAASTADLKP